MGQTAVIPPQIVDVAARSLLGNNTASAAACQTISFSAASAGQVLTVQGDGSVAFAAVSAGIGGSTGSTDNAVLRADGIGGATLQSSGWIVPDIFTASPNATVNHLSLQATGSSTNVSVSIVPKVQPQTWRVGVRRFLVRRQHEQAAIIRRQSSGQQLVTGRYA
jgi:hypothetical protein